MLGWRIRWTCSPTALTMRSALWPCLQSMQVHGSLVSVRGNGKTKATTFRRTSSGVAAAVPSSRKCGRSKSQPSRITAKQQTGGGKRFAALRTWGNVTTRCNRDRDLQILTRPKQTTCTTRNWQLSPKLEARTLKQE